MRNTLILFFFLLGHVLLAQTFYKDVAPGTDKNTAPNYSASSTVAGTTSMEVLDSKRQLGRGDRVSFRVVEDRKDPIALVVTDSGEMEVPLIGRVMASGKTPKQLAFEIKALLEKEYYKQASVIIGLDTVSARSPGRIYVTGQVRQQGPMEIPPDEVLTVSKAILKAGGFADFANKRKVKLVRKNEAGANETFVVDLVQVFDKGDSSKDMVLQPDDYIIVPERLINF